MPNFYKIPWTDDPLLFLSIKEDDYSTFVEKVYHHFHLINTPNIYGETLAHYCCYLGYIDKYYALIHMGAEIKKTKIEDTLLHYASLGGKDSFLVTELAKNGMSPLEKNKYGITPIHLSSDETTTSYFLLWLEINNIPLNSIVDNRKNNPAHIAIKNGFNEIANYWINHNHQLEDALNIDNKKPREMILEPYLVCPY